MPGMGFSWRCVRRNETSSARTWVSDQHTASVVGDAGAPYLSQIFNHGRVLIVQRQRLIDCAVRELDIGGVIWVVDGDDGKPMAGNLTGHGAVKKTWVAPARRENDEGDFGVAGTAWS